MKFPKPLKAGATIGLIQPSGSISEKAFVKALANIESMGFKVYHQPEMPRKNGYLGGTDQQKADELHHMFSNPDVDAIWCVRGGYGTQRLLHLLDYKLIANNPKPFIGFSDITALLNTISQATDLVTYHGLMGVSEFSTFDRDIFQKMVMEQNHSITLSPLQKHIESNDEAFHPYVVNEGTALGKLAGGNLALLASAIGTPYDINCDEKILLIEEVGEAPYRIDRMLTQLLRAGKFDKVAGIALGIFKGCHPTDHDWKEENSFSVKEVIMDRLSSLKIPIMYGLPFGHIAENATLPIGAKAKLDTKKKELSIYMG